MSPFRRIAAGRFAYVVILPFLLSNCLSFAHAGDNRVIKSKPAGAVISEANRPAEITLVAEKEHADPFNDVVLDAVFITAQGKKLKVPAFWAGGRTWRLRYSSHEVGEHRFLTVCSHTSDKGLDSVAGKIEVRPYSGNNSLYRHGPIRVAADRRHFEHLDGTPFFWLGDTWWMGMCQRLGWPGEFKTLAADRKTKGFNVVQIVAGLYPDMGAFDERGRNEAGFPWEKDYRSIRPAYFDKADERLQYLADQGLVPCLVGAWGYHLPWLGVERMKKHWRYLVARYGALPVVWCAAGEVNLPYYLEKGFPRGGQKQTADWEAVIRYLRTIDAFGRLITVHPTGLPPLSGRALYKDQSLLDFDMLQTGHDGRASLGPTVRAVRASYQGQPTLPVVNGEVCYEALLGRIDADVVRLMFWVNILCGAAGHTFGANGIWQVNCKGRPYGKSPHGGDYGHIPWDEAMKLPGSGQLAHARRLLERYAWYKFEPHPEWASWQAGAKSDDPREEFLVPYAAGVPGSVRMVYVPRPLAITLHGLEPTRRYVANYFDPLSGRRTEIGAVRADDRGEFVVHPPKETRQDWVLALEL
jgi:Protein of unknown function (DUF4038)/Domain of unknown function (DUF5060)/Putative collagen-binding domain of a collagenase